MSQNQLGWVYILSNPSFKEGMIKIGFTNKNNPQERAQELSKHTGVPTEFEVVYAVQVMNAHDLETRVHHILQHKRARNNREFFECSINEAVQTINSTAGRSIINKIDNRAKQNTQKHTSQTSRKTTSPNKQQNRGFIFTLLILLMLFFAAMLLIGWNVEQKEQSSTPTQSHETPTPKSQSPKNTTPPADDVQAAWQKIPPEIRETLNEEQNEWLREKQKRCAQSSNKSVCEKEMNEARVRYLRGFSI